MRRKIISRNILVITIVSLVISLLNVLPELSIFFEGNEVLREVYEGSLNEVIRDGIVSFLIMIILFGANLAVFRFYDPTQKIGPFKIILSWVFLFIFGSLVREIFYHTIYGEDFTGDINPQFIFYYMTHFLRDMVTTIIVFFVSYAFYLISKQHMMIVENQRLHTESVKNQYESLKSQLNPHMMFNSLNTLSTLVDESQEKAKDYIHELSYVLRYALQQSENLKIGLEQEIGYSNAYIFLQKMRYEDNLNFNIEVSEAAQKKQVPPMSLQLLIENAIKHNQISTKKPLTVNIYTENDNWLIVSNAIQPKFSVSRTNTEIGLENLKKRYLLLVNKEIEIDKSNGMFTVRMPLIEPDKVKV